MLTEFFKIKEIGTLFIDEIFFFYEEPQIFTCITKAGAKYICLLTDMDKKEWLLVPISEARLSLLKCNRISVKKAFANPEDDMIWRAHYDSNASILIPVQINPNDILEDDMPDDDYYLDFTNDCLMPVINEDIVKSSIKEYRDILDMSLEINGNHFREISCDILGEVLTNTQQLVYALAYKNDNIRGPVPKAIKDKNTLQVVGTFAASFGIRFKSIEIGDLMGETSVSPTLQTLSDLLIIKNDQEKLRSFLSSQGRRAVIKYRNLMKSLVQANAGLKVKGASPNEKYFHVNFSQDDIVSNLSILEGEISNMVSTEVLYGDIVGINVDKKTFAFNSVDGEHITGKLSDGFIDTVFEVPKQVEIQVEQRVDINDLTKEERYMYTLLKINNIVASS